MQQISYNSVEDITDDIRKQIGWRIQEKRIEKGITAVDLSTYLNITANQVSRIERGCAGIDIYKLIVICKILGVSADYILFGEMKEENITLRGLNMTLLSKDSGYIPSYKRTKLTDALHNAFGFRTDYEFISKFSMRSIIKETKQKK